MEKSHSHPNLIPFMIDRTEYKIASDQNPVTGQYLRQLASVPADYDLWFRARGNEDDTVVKPEDSVEVRQGDHFYTSKRELNPGDTKK